MPHHARLALAAGLCLAAPGLASAHAHLKTAVPSAGAKVSPGPGDLTLAFTENVEPALSRVAISTAKGAPVAADKPTIDGSNRAVLHVHLAQPLPPGAYVVLWHAVAVDTHRTSGSYKFTVQP